MKIEEVEGVLLFASGLDHFVTVDSVTSDAWFRVLSKHDVSYEQAMTACEDHYAGPNRGKQFTVGHIIDSAAVNNRATAELVEVDVRAAKARGLVSKDWPDRERLPSDVQAKLFAARELMRVDAPDYSELSADTVLRIGSVGRVTP
jgi:hypothetical protein